VAREKHVFKLRRYFCVPVASHYQFMNNLTYFNGL